MMRRVTAKQLAPFAGSLADGVCCVCGAKGIAVLAAGRNENGAIERQYCRIEPCAKAEGWPWIGRPWKSAA
ncbi:MAG: hypothetical protein ACYCZB_18200 [Acidiphilium sp.]